MTFSFSNTFWAQTFRYGLILGFVALGPALGSVQNEDELYQEGVRLRKAEQYQEAITCFQPLANKGDPKAQHNMGSCYYHMSQKQDAQIWWEKAADQGLEAARANLEKLKLENPEKETPFKGNWTKSFRLVDGSLVHHTPEKTSLGFFSGGTGVTFKSKMYNGFAMSPKGFVLKTDSTEQEFVQALLDSGLYKP